MRPTLGGAWLGCYRARQAILRVPPGGQPAATGRGSAPQAPCQYEIITEGEISPKWVEGHQGRLRVYLLPFFGDLGVSPVTQDTAQQDPIYRLTGTRPRQEAPPIARPRRPR